MAIDQMIDDDQDRMRNRLNCFWGSWVPTLPVGTKPTGDGLSFESRSIQLVRSQRFLLLRQGPERLVLWGGGKTDLHPMRANGLKRIKYEIGQSENLRK